MVYRYSIVAGSFDPLHDGHIDHFIKASKFGDYLIVLVSLDSDSIRKKGKVCLPQELRMKIIDLVLGHYKINGRAMPTIDEDGTQNKSLAFLANVLKGMVLTYCKGGDRTPDNMVQSEIDTCSKYGIELVYGEGDLLNSSTKIAEAMRW